MNSAPRHKIDVNSIMKELEEKLSKGLSDGTLDATGISRLIGEHLEKTKEKVIKDTRELIREEAKPSENESCKDCGSKLKKQKNRPTIRNIYAIRGACIRPQYGLLQPLREIVRTK